MTFDFQSIKERVIQYLKSKYAWADMFDFSANSYFIDAFCNEIAEQARFNTYLTTETKWDLARNISSLASQCNPLSYKPQRKKAAKGTLRISYSETFDSKYTKTILIPKGTSFTNGSIKFVCTQNESLLATQNYTDIEVIQGIQKSVTLYSKGLNFEKVTISNSNINYENLEVYVNGELWESQNNILTYESNGLYRVSSSSDKIYVVKNNYDFSGISITFGNNIYGKKLFRNDEIKIYYIETLGLNGNIVQKNVITTIEDTIYDVDAAQVQIYCKNTSFIDGGRDEETLNEIRLNAPRVFQSGLRAVTKEDYEALLNQNQYIEKNITWGEFEYLYENGYNVSDTTNFIPLLENKVFISALTPSGNNLNEFEKENIVAYLNDYKSPTDIINFIDVEFIYLQFEIDAYVSNRSYSLTTVKNNISSSLSTEYNLFNMEFAQNIYESDYKGFIDNIEGVGYHDSKILLYNYFYFTQVRSADIGCSLFPLIPYSSSNNILTGIKIYIRQGNPEEWIDSTWTYIARDDGNGNIISDNALYTISGSYIGYTTGIGNLNLVLASDPSKSFLDYTIKVLYAIEDKNYITKKKNQIFAYDDSNINIAYTN
jgi:hypothetical protein